MIILVGLEALTVTISDDILHVLVLQSTEDAEEEVSLRKFTRYLVRVREVLGQYHRILTRCRHHQMTRTH